MASLKDNLAYIFASMTIAVAKHLSLKQANLFGSVLGNLFYHLLPSRRKIATENIERALGPDIDRAEIDRIVKEVFRNIVRTFIESYCVNRLDDDKVKKIIVSSDLDVLKKVHDAGKGAVLVTAHFGNWELLPRWVTSLGYEFDALAAIQHNAKIDRLITNLRERKNVRVIPVNKSAPRKVFQALKANRFVGIVADQHDPSRSLIMDFFGRKAAVPRGPALFAIKAGCPVIPLLIRRESYERYFIIVGESIYPSQIDGELEEKICEISARYNKFFEENIRKYPAQWMWTHRRWKI
ncbi:MAG: lysophospholipid acyltransferase family protein [FCB group bacterium]|nr:lysophospholipid acyltransferase family protein [FCB group bacterium]